MSNLIKHGFNKAEKLGAEEFLGLLRRSNDKWWNNGRCGWVFRGIGNALDWSLTPSAWRSKETNKLHPLIQRFEALQDEFGPDDPRVSGEASQAWATAELHAIKQFAELGIELGHKLPSPGGSIEFAQDVHVYGFMKRSAPHAQHHGIPTRLLDWTHDPMTAAYFALSPVFRDPNAELVCVWALNRHSKVTDKMGNNGGFTLNFVEQAPSENEYLRAQKGLFSWVYAESFYDENGDWPSLETLCESVWAEAYNATPFLEAYALHASEFNRALELLDREAINHAALMPSLDNVAKTTIARWQRGHWSD